jgi:DNA primase catalytic core
MISAATIEAINEAARIEEVVGDFVDLKRAGSGMKACCPFHAEKTPSFNVSPARNIFKCFGCGKGGGPVAFLMEQGKTYPEALDWLGKKYRIPIEALDGKPDAYHDAKTQLRATASALYAHFSLTQKDDLGRKYWLDRGLTAETLDEFGVGYCDGTKPPHVADDQLSALGVINDKGNLTLYRRSVIPIHDRTGRVSAFAGRMIEEKEGVKYLNSAESLIYKKGSTLFNLHRASPHIRRSREIWIVEGYADAMAAWQLGLKNVVALCGTALTDAMVAQIKKFNGDTPLRIVLALDNEIEKPAGDDAQAYKVQVAMAYYTAIEKLLPIGEVVRMKYPRRKGRALKDIADMIAANLDPQAAEKVDVINDYVERKLGEDDWGEKASPVQRADFQEHVARLVSKVKRESVRDIYIKSLYDLLQVTPKKMADLVAKYEEKKEDGVAYDILNHRYIAVKDEFRERIPEKDKDTGEVWWKYQTLKKSTITDQFGAAYIKTIPRFTKAVVEPSHLDYLRTIRIDTDDGTYNYFNDYEPLKFQPKAFSLPEAFGADPYGYDYTSIPEIQHVASLFRHIFDQGKNALGDDYLQIAWDWLTIMYLMPKERLPCIGLVSKEEGTGKSTLINVLARFFGANASKIDASRIAAKFNALMGGKVLVYCEETKDDRGQMENVLKDLITGFEMVVERKFGDAEVMPTFCKFLLASNHPETFMKVGTATTRFFITQVQPIPKEKKLPNMEQLCYLELPYLAYFLQKRGVMTPYEDRLWMKPERYENEALIRLREASKDVVEQNMEALIADIFLKCEMTTPVLLLTSGYLKDLMCAYAGKLYEQKTPRYFQNVAMRELRADYRDVPARREAPELKGILSHSWATDELWPHDMKRMQGRFLGFPIWRHLRPAEVSENYPPDKLAQLVATMERDGSEIDQEGWGWLQALKHGSDRTRWEPKPEAENPPF